MKKIKLLKGLLLMILCTTIFITGCGKKEEKAKITLTKTQIKYEENAKDRVQVIAAMEKVQAYTRGELDLDTIVTSYGIENKGMTL